MTRWCRQLPEYLRVLSNRRSRLRNLPGLSSRFPSSWFNLTSCNGLAFTGPIVLLEGSPSKSANLKAVVELKFMLAAINQSTPVIEYNLLTDSIAPFSILLASSMKLTLWRSSFISSSLYLCQGDDMGLDHINEPLLGLSSRLVLVVSDLVSDLDVPAVSSIGLTGPILLLG